MLSFCSPLRAHNNMMHAAAPRAISALAISEGRGTKSNLVTTKPHCLLCFCAPGRQQLREGTSWAQEASPRCTPVQGDLPRLGTHFPYPDRKQSEISKKFVAKQEADTTSRRSPKLGKIHLLIHLCADGMFSAGCGSSPYWQTLTTKQRIPGGQQSIPGFQPALVNLFLTSTSLASISCSDFIPF